MTEATETPEGLVDLSIAAVASLIDRRVNRPAPIGPDEARAYTLLRRMAERLTECTADLARLREEAEGLRRRVLKEEAP